MKSITNISTLLLALLTSSATAQLLTQGNGQLPQCGQSCTVLTNAQQQCNGQSSATLQTWSCFCKAVWTGSGQSPDTMCTAQCTNPQDNTAISTWYTDNCGSDNGASEHGGGSGGSGTNGGAPASSSGAASSDSSSDGSDAAPTSGDSGCTGSWWNCHWQWVIMIIVVALGLIALGFGGRWLKRRHDRKKDQISGGFNQGITERAAPMNNDKANDSSYGNAAGFEAGSGRDSPARTREAFMPYGYGYARSESRMGESTRGGTPINDLEKEAGSRRDLDQSESTSRRQSRRVLVRERSGGDES